MFLRFRRKRSYGTYAQSASAFIIYVLRGLHEHREWYVRRVNDIVCHHMRIHLCASTYFSWCLWPWLPWLSLGVWPSKREREKKEKEKKRKKEEEAHTAGVCCWVRVISA